MIGSNISGDTVSITAGDDLTVRASTIVATNDLNLSAGNDLTIGSVAETGAEEHYKKTKKSGLFGGGGLGFTIGSRTEKNTVNEKILAEIGSSIGSLAGNVSLSAGDHFASSGSSLIAGKDLDIIGKEITIDNTKDIYDSYRKHEVKQSGLSVSLGGGSVDTAMNAVNSIERANQVSDERLQALYAYKAGKDIKELSEFKNNEGFKKDVAISVSIGQGYFANVGSGKSKEHESTVTNVGSVINASRD